MERKDKETFSVAVTGSLGSGKSLALAWFRERGYKTESADDIGHELLVVADIREKIITVFGEDILQGDSIDRKKLGNIVFSDQQKLQVLNDILHPAIIDTIKQQIRTSEEEFIFFEIPLLFETGTQYMFHLTVNIAATQQSRIQRLQERDKLAEEEIRKRFETQLPDDVKKKKADVTIDNDCRKECLYNQLQLLERLIRSKVK